MSKLSELLQKAKEQREQKSPKGESLICSPPSKNLIHGTDKYGKPITFNEEQSSFIRTVRGGKSCVLIGAAGTGKTSSVNGAISLALRESYIPPIGGTHKYLPSDSPGIVAVSFTRRAVANLKKAVPTDLRDNCITIHKLLEYGPSYYDVFDEASVEWKTKMEFAPARNRENTLPSGISTIIFDESSMISVDLFYKVFVALPNPMAVQFIFLGDIQQLPPVFGSAILGYKLLSLPVIELTQVYRQALESPIIRLAHRILSGVEIPSSEFTSLEEDGKLRIHPWKKKVRPEAALPKAAELMEKLYDTREYDPSQDMVLIPFNKGFGTLEFNKHIATHISRKNGRTVFEVISGFQKCYFSIGDRVLCDKEDGEITDIKWNPAYGGKRPTSESSSMNYWGEFTSENEHEFTLSSESEQDIDSLLESMASEEIEDRVTQASHIITVRLTATGEYVHLKSAAELNTLLLSYSLTIHKSQGSEYRKVFLLLHNSHATMLQRELLYTAVTRARESLYIVCDPDTFVTGIKGQRIKGKTITEKAEFFRGKLEKGDDALLAEIQALDAAKSAQ